LGNLVDRRAIGPLVLALKDTTSSMRRMAAAALARINPRWNATSEARSAVEELKQALQHEDSNLRHFVGLLLPSLGETPAESVPRSEPGSGSAPSATNRRKLAIDLFETLLGDPDQDLRRSAAEALGQLGDAHSRSALQRVRSDADPGVRGAAERALGLLGTEPA
jgi:HEAT repeat protein